MSPSGHSRALLALALLALFAGSCRGNDPQRQGASTAASNHPSILLVTLDTTRADAIGPRPRGSRDAGVQRARRARPPLPAGLRHGAGDAAVAQLDDDRPLSRRPRRARERAASSPPAHPVARRAPAAGRLSHGGVRLVVRAGAALRPRARVRRLRRRAAGRRSRSARARRRPIARSRISRSALGAGRSSCGCTTSIRTRRTRRPSRFAARYANEPYLGEVAAMDEQLGRLVSSVRAACGGPVAIVVVADHGEGLGDHGERQHGNLLYQSTMHVPLVIVGPGSSRAASVDAPVSTRRVFHTLLDLGRARRRATACAAGSAGEVVLGEAMKPFLGYGWQPQVMAVEGRRKAILAGRLEIYDVVADPGGDARPRREREPVAAAARQRCATIPLPSPGAARSAGALSEDAQRKLASLGYVERDGGAGRAQGRAAARGHDAPVRAARAARRACSCASEYAQASFRCSTRSSPTDPDNLDAALRLATAHSSLGHDAQALAAFERAAAIAPASPDVRDVSRAALRARQGLAARRAAARAGRRRDAGSAAGARGAGDDPRASGAIGEAMALRQKIYSLRAPSAAELVQLGELAMAAQRDADCDRGVREGAGAGRAAASRTTSSSACCISPRGGFAEARDALDRVPPQHPRLSDGALQARPGQRAAERARPRRADRTGAEERGCHDARADRAGTVVSVVDSRLQNARLARCWESRSWLLRELELRAFRTGNAPRSGTAADRSTAAAGRTPSCGPPAGCCIRSACRTR